MLVWCLIYVNDFTLITRILSYDFCFPTLSTDKGKPHGFKTKCEFCPASYGILHPGDGKYVCGKRNQRDEFFLLRNRLLSSDAILMAQERSREGATVSRAGPKQPGLGPVRPLMFLENSRQGFCSLLFLSYCLDQGVKNAAMPYKTIEFNKIFFLYIPASTLITDAHGHNYRHQDLN